MISKAQIIEARAIAIIRGDFAAVYRPLAEALLAGGVRAMEITLNSSGALAGIQTLVREYPEALVGVGTVTTVEQVAQAADAGAGYVVSPHTDPAIIRAAHQRGMLTMPGAYTATEAMTAHHAGADFVKLFPATVGGAAYLRNLRAPLDMIDFIPTGGIDADNVGEFLAAGAVAVGIGGSLVGKDFDGSPQHCAALSAAAARLMAAILAN